jgi:hypothetical protein
MANSSGLKIGGPLGEDTVIAFFTSFRKVAGTGF